MLTGRRAFAGDTAEDVLSAILTKEPPPLADACPDAPIALQKVVSRALAKRAEDRFASARALEHALEAVSNTRGRPRRARAVMVAAAVLLVVAVAGGAIYCGNRRPVLAAPEAGSVMPKHPRTAVAVLPLQNLSADAAHAYFAGGLHDEVITQLSKVAALNVIGRTSVMGYRGTTPPLAADRRRTRRGNRCRRLGAGGGRAAARHRESDRHDDQHTSCGPIGSTAPWTTPLPYRARWRRRSWPASAQPCRATSRRSLATAPTANPRPTACICRVGSTTAAPASSERT